MDVVLRILTALEKGAAAQSRAINIAVSARVILTTFSELITVLGHETLSL